MTPNCLLVILQGIGCENCPPYQDSQNLSNKYPHMFWLYEKKKKKNSQHVNSSFKKSMYTHTQLDVVVFIPSKHVILELFFKNLHLQSR